LVPLSIDLLEVLSSGVLYKEGAEVQAADNHYEKWYEGDAYYWGLEPGDFLDELFYKMTHMYIPALWEEATAIFTGKTRKATVKAARRIIEADPNDLL